MEKNKSLVKSAKKISKNQIMHIILIVVGIIFVNSGIIHTNLWFDETYSVGMASKSFVDIWNIGGYDVHPVLYYWMLHIIYLLTGGSILAYRIFSGIGISILGILGYTHIRKDFGEKTGLLFSFLIYFSPITAYFANQIRMYTWAMLFVTILAIYAWRLAHEEKAYYYIIFFLSSLASIYIHYYGLMAAGLINLVLLIYLIKNKKKSIYTKQIILGVLQGLLYLPWMIYFASQLKTMHNNKFWISVDIETIFEILNFSFSGSLNEWIGFIISIPVYGYLGYSIIKAGKGKNKPAAYAILIYLLIIIAAFILGYVVGTALLYYRYLIIVTGLMFFAIAYVYIKQSKKYPVIALTIVILITGIASNIVMAKENYNKQNLAPYEYLRENIQKGDVIVYNNIGAGAPYAVRFSEYKQYFYNEEDWGVEEAYKAYGPGMNTYITTDFLDDEECQGRIWLIVSPENTKLYDKEFANNEKYKIISEKNFKINYYKESEHKIILIERNK